jgi:hypothetical protein
MRMLLIIAGVALCGCQGSDSSAANTSAAELAVRQEFGRDAMIIHPVIDTDVHGRSVMCGYVTTAGVEGFPGAAFIWTKEGFDVSRWNDPQHAVVDQRARALCGADWVVPWRGRAVS